MPVYRIHQVATHPMFPKEVGEKTSHIIGRDLGHAIESLNLAKAGFNPPEIEGIKRQLRKKYWARATDRLNRTLYIEIKEELKS